MVLLSFVPLRHASGQIDEYPQEKEIFTQQLMVQAMTQSFLGNHDRAILLYEQALQNEPFSSTLNASIAQAYEKNGDIMTAILYAQQASTLDSSNTHHSYYLGQLYQESGDLDKAVEELESLLLRVPNHTAALHALLSLHTQKKAYAEAITTANRLQKLVGPDKLLLEKKLEIYREMEETAGTEATLQELQQLDPSNTTFKVELVELYISQSRRHEAIQYLREELTKNPTDLDMTLALATLYADADTTRKEAIVLLKSTLETAPEYEDALILLGSTLFEEHEYAEASVLLERALSQNPRNSILWYQAARSLLHQGKINEALSLAEEGLLLFPGNTHILFVSAMVHMNKFDIQQAVMLFNELLPEKRRAATQSSNDSERMIWAESYSYLGVLYAKQGQVAASDSALTMAMALHDTHPQVFHNTALAIIAKGGDLTLSLDFAQKAVDLKPASSQFIGTQGWIYLQLGKVEEAERLFTHAMKTTAPTALLNEQYGDLLLEQGRINDAIAIWNVSLSQNPNNTALVEKIKKHLN